MTGATETAGGRDLVRRNAVLYVLCVVLVCVVVALGLFAQTRDGGIAGRAGDVLGLSAAGDAPADPEGDDLHAAVLRAASEEVLAFVNVDHEDIKASTDHVLEGATGEFRKQYRKTLSSLRRVMRREQSVMTGEILSAGVVAADQENATVLVATKGTVSNRNTGGEETARNLRLQVELTYVDGRWLTHDLQFVG